MVPLNPALVWIERRLCFERELACDDAVLRLTKAPKAYATCLTSLAEHRLGRRAAVLSLGAWERRSELARRVHRILRGDGRNERGLQASLVMRVVRRGLLGGAVDLAEVDQVGFVFAKTVSVASFDAGLPTDAGYQAVAFRAVPTVRSRAPRMRLC